MPLKLFRRPGSKIYEYRGTPVKGDRLRGSTGTSDRQAAKEFAAAVERAAYQHSRPSARKGRGLTFPQAVELYLNAGKPGKFLPQVIAYWKHKAIREGRKETLVKDMTAGVIRQSAIDIYPEAGGATRNRQVITPTQAVINYCAELEYCPPIRIKRFKFEKKIKPPVTVDWLDTFCAHARPLTAALATFMFATACRISEARRLEWSDIDFQQRAILIVKTKAKKQRLPHMPQRLLVALANLPRDQKPFYWSETRLRDFWDQDIAKTAEAVPGFQRLTFHSCRHGFVTKLLRDGHDVKTVADLAGLTVQVLLDTYAHAVKDATVTEGIFDTNLARRRAVLKQNNGLE